jgi:hypothetical protein
LVRDRQGFKQVRKKQVRQFHKAITDGTFPGLMKSGSLFKTYVDEGGFSDNSVNFGKTIHEAKDGTIWIGTEERLTAFHPGAETTDTIPPNIQLTGLALFNEKNSMAKLR